jgi:hypothetical protein
MLPQVEDHCFKRIHCLLLLERSVSMPQLVVCLCSFLVVLRFGPEVGGMLLKNVRLLPDYVVLQPRKV